MRDGGDTNGVVLLTSIVDEFVCSLECPVCFGDGIVCENHPDRVWDPDGSGVGCGCGAGMPCPSIAEAREVLGFAHCICPYPEDGFVDNACPTHGEAQ